jgi:hypothetical protein
MTILPVARAIVDVARGVDERAQRVAAIRKVDLASYTAWPAPSTRSGTRSAALDTRRLLSCAGWPTGTPPLADSLTQRDALA